MAVRTISGLDIRHWLVCGIWFPASSRACRQPQQIELPANYASAKPAGCWAYFNLDSFKKKYGRLPPGGAFLRKPVRKQQYDDISASQGAKLLVNDAARLLAFCCARRLGLPVQCSNCPSSFERNDLDYPLKQICYSRITSVLSERPLKFAGQKTERCKILNPQYNIDRDQPTSQASPLRINTLLYSEIGH